MGSKYDAQVEEAAAKIAASDVKVPSDHTENVEAIAWPRALGNSVYDCADGEDGGVIGRVCNVETLYSSLLQGMAQCEKTAAEEAHAQEESETMLQSLIPLREEVQERQSKCKDLASGLHAVTEDLKQAEIERAELIRQKEIVDSSLIQANLALAERRTALGELRLSNQSLENGLAKKGLFGKSK